MESFRRMTNLPPGRVSETEMKVVEAAIQQFLRFGARKTSMSDIASQAGVSRQTLYDLFGGKDALIRASIAWVTEQSLDRINQRLISCRDLGERLEVILQETVANTTDTAQPSVALYEIIGGHNESGAQAVEEANNRMRELVQRLLTEHSAKHNVTAPADGPGPAQLANLVVTVATSLRRVKNIQERTELMTSLKYCVLAAQPGSE